MATVKELVASGISDQESLVKALLSKVPNRLVKFVIPAGKHLFQKGYELDIDGLNRHLYTWLRHVTDFEECTLSFARTPSLVKTTTTKVIDFPADMVNPIWALPSKGKTYLAKIIAEQINAAKSPPVFIHVKRDGLYIATDVDGKFGPGHENWEPYVEFKRTRKSNYSPF